MKTGGERGVYPVRLVLAGKGDVVPFDSESLQFSGRGPVCRSILVFTETWT